MKSDMWLIHDGSIWYEDLLRSSGWTYETLKAPHAYRVSEKVKPITEDLIDDIESLCLSIEMRQKELKRLIKKLKD